MQRNAISTVKMGHPAQQTKLQNQAGAGPAHFSMSYLFTSIARPKIDRGQTRPSPIFLQRKNRKVL